MNHCQCCRECGSKCALAPFLKLFDLISHSDIDSAGWWQSVRASRDEALAVMRKGPADPIVSVEDMQYWRAYQARLERLSARLDRDYARFAESRLCGGLAGHA
jgi:hypothetical protein